MRSIEDLAAEEEARIRRVRVEWLAKFSAWFLAFLLAAGWFLFAGGDLPWGSLLVALALLGFLVRSGAFSVFPHGSARFLVSLLMGAFAFALFRATAAPTFLDGRDPSFWLAALTGQVVEPSWSPLSYLLVRGVTASKSVAEAAVALPLVSAFCAALAVFMACQSRFFQGLFGEGWRTGPLFAAFLASSAFLLSRPLWSAATAASGVPATLGLILFLWYDRALSVKNPAPLSARAFLFGLTFSAHPLWGLMALFSFAVKRPPLDLHRPSRWAWFLAGLTPYLWVPIRAEKVFPSWGGKDPLGTWVAEGWDVLVSRWMNDWDPAVALSAWGMPVAWLSAFVLLRLLLASKDQPMAVSRLSAVVLALSFLLGSFFHSERTGLLAPVALLVPLLLAQTWVPRERTSPTRKSGLPTGRGGWDGRIAVLAGAVILAVVPQQRTERQDADLARRHALNLMVSAGPRTAILFEDPGEADACRVLQRTEGVAPGALLLDRGRLTDKRYLSGLILHRPEWLFSSGTGSVDAVFQDMILENIPRWDVRWAISGLPSSWDGVLAGMGRSVHPQVLVQRIVASGTDEPAFEDLSARMDLSGLFPPPLHPDAAFRMRRDRYTRGFMELGDRMARLGRTTLAIRSYERAAKVDPSFEAPREALARLYTEEKVLEAARMDFTKVLKDHPALIRSWMEKVGEFGKDGKDPRVLKALDEVIRLNVELSDAHYHLGILYRREGRDEEAAKLIESAVTLAPQRVEAQMELGRLMLRAGNRVKAEAAFRAVLGVDPQNKEAQRQLWRLLNRP